MDHVSEMSPLNEIAWHLPFPVSANLQSQSCVVLIHYRQSKNCHIRLMLPVRENPDYYSRRITFPNGTPGTYGVQYELGPHLGLKPLAQP